jgi:enoyl-CoA hydratase/3-hydroxyacyl-CoA dehydrogenase
MKVEDLKRVAVIGAGDMGHGIAEIALMAGLEVFLYDVKQDYLDRGVNRIYESLDILLSKGKITQATYDFSRTHLYPTLDLAEAVADVQLVLEAVPEVLELKQKLFEDLEAAASPDTILATNTSNMGITEIAAKVKKRDRIVGLHFFNPVVMMKLVEVIRGKETTDEVMQTAYDLCLKFNKTPVRVEKDTPSFIVNRLNAPVRVFLGAVVDSGIADPEEIDALVRSHGNPMGPFELSDYVGLDVTYYSMVYRINALGPEYGPNRLLEEKVESGNLGKKTGKGFYDWTIGRPVIDLSKKTDKIKIDDLVLVKLNEAAKLIEDGVATPKDIDLAMRLGTGDKKGPIEACRDLTQEEIINRLDYLVNTYQKEILRPTRLIREQFEKLSYQ